MREDVTDPSRRRAAIVLAAAGVAALGAAHVLARTSTYGAAVFNDSAGYLVWALHIMEWDWQDVEIQPPFFPLSLAFASLVSGVEPVETARFMNAAAFGATIFLSGLWLWRRLRSGFLAIAAAAAIALSAPLSDAASSVMTEAVFSLLVVLALTQLDSFLAGGAERRKRRLAAAAITAALAAVTRYAGVTAILAGVLALLLDRRRRMADRVRNAAVFGAVSSAPLAAWLAKNWVETGQATGERWNAGFGLADTFGQALGVLGAWALPVADGGVPAAAGALAALLAAGAWVWRREAGRSDAGSAPACFIFIIVYPAFIVAAVPTTSWQEVDSRFLTPLYAPLVLAAALLVHRLAAARAGRGAVSGRVLAVAVIAALGAHAGLSARANFDATRAALEHGYGYESKAYNTGYWDEFDLFAYMRSVPADDPVFDNDPTVMVAGLHRTHTMEGYRRTPDWWGHKWGPPMLPKGDIDDFRRWFADVPEGAHIVWYSYFGLAVTGVFEYDFHDLLCLPGLRTMRQTENGVVFRVDRGHTPDCRPDLPPGAPVVRGAFDVRLDGGVLVYSRIPCARTDTRLRFFLHVVPANLDDLSEDRREFGFDNLDFLFDEYGSRLGEACVARVALPEYPVAAIRTGQADWPADPAWSGEYEFPGGSRG